MATTLKARNSQIRRGLWEQAFGPYTKLKRALATHNPLVLDLKVWPKVSNHGVKIIFYSLSIFLLLININIFLLIFSFFNFLIIILKKMGTCHSSLTQLEVFWNYFGIVLNYYGNDLCLWKFLNFKRKSAKNHQFFKKIIRIF